MGFGTQSSSSSSRETSLTRAQADVVRRREGQYQSVFFPELVAELTAAGDSASTSQYGRAARQRVGSAYASGKRQLSQSLEQRGLADSGIGAMSLQSLEMARSNALADALSQAEEQRRARKMQLLQMGGSLSPTPTTAAPMAQQASGSGFNVAFK